MKKASLFWLTGFMATNIFAATPVKEAEFTYVAQDTKLWSEPTRFGVAEAMLKTGLELQVTEYSSNNSWMKVKTPSGREGWVPLRFTTQAGRRSFPLNADLGGASNAQSQQASQRAPASLGGTASATAGAMTEPVVLKVPHSSSSDSWEAQVGLEYINQLTREATSGFGADLSAVYRLHNSWALGAALSWNYFSKSVRDEMNGNSTQRSSHRISPYLVGRFRYDAFRLDLGVGYALDRSRIESRMGDGTLAPTLPDGTITNGSGSESSLALKITPRIILPMSRALKIGFYASYIMDVAFGSGEGNFAGAADAVSPPYSYFNVGMSLGVDF